jgi:hypothetical protein
MIEAGTITGTIESNNGAEALVSFADGAQKLFKRGPESKKRFLTNFPIGGTVEAKRLACNVSTRQDLFDAIENLFGDRGITYSVVGISKRGKIVLAGSTLNISGLAVFCAPFFESPDGSDGEYFALGREEQWEWLELTPENFEYVCGEIANAGHGASNIQDLPAGVVPLP